jgi:acyl-CoA hydrolase/RimJ/RimL family protein N-acetyltransferase
MDIQQYCPEKVVTAAQAVSRIKNGSRVFIGSGCGEPRHLIHAMVADPGIQDIMVFQMLAFTLGEYLQTPGFLKRFAIKLFFVTIPMREAAYQGKIDYIPAYLSEIPSFFKSGQIGLDAALIQISPPDRFGLASLGVSVDVTREAVRNTGLVIAQVNPFMPRTHGDSFIHVDDIDCLVPYAEELLEHVPEEADERIAKRIAHYVSELIDDGSTLQAGYGQMPYAILKYLDRKNDLGVHTHMITDSFIPLFEQGIITNKRKNFLADRAVATFCMGTRRIYDYIDNNPRFYFGTSDFVNSPRTIGRNDNLISISSALEVDLTGQVCVDSVGRQFFSGTGDQTNFIRGAALSKGGLSIIALPSTAKNGTVSRIVPTLSAGAGLGTLRADVNFVVTEYGTAQLQGKSIYQRVIELTQIAHPDFRAELVDAAKHHHYIFFDQLPPPAVDLIFIEDYKSSVRLKSGQTLSVRPLLPSDEISYRNFFYSLQQETIFFRFFYNINIFSHKMAQAHWAKLDYRKNISLVGLVRKKGNKEIVAIGTYAGLDQDQAEVAFVVREDFQGMGIATYLLKALEKVAIQNGFKCFYASILPENQAMLHVFTKTYSQARVEHKENEIRICMDLAATTA